MNRVFVDCFDCVFLAKYPAHAICPEGKVISLRKSIEVIQEPRYRDTEGKVRSTKVHQMIAEAFVPNPRNKKNVGHIDGNKRNNHPSNLYWGQVSPAHQKLTEEDVRSIYHLFAEGMNNMEIAEKFNVSPDAISLVRCGKSWERLYGEFYKDGSKPMQGYRTREECLTEEQVKEIYVLLSNKRKNKDIAKDFGVTPTTISAIKRGKNYKHLYHLYKQVQRPERDCS